MPFSFHQFLLPLPGSLFWNFPYPILYRQHGGAAVSTFVSQQEAPRSEFHWGRAFLCVLCMPSPCLHWFLQGTLFSPTITLSTSSTWSTFIKSSPGGLMLSIQPPYCNFKSIPTTCTPCLITWYECPPDSATFGCFVSLFMFAFRSNIALPHTWVVTWLYYKVFFVCFPHSVSVFWNGKYQQHKDTSKCSKCFPCSGHSVMVCLLTGTCCVLLLWWEICILGGKTVVSAIYINILPLPEAISPVYLLSMAPTQIHCTQTKQGHKKSKGRRRLCVGVCMGKFKWDMGRGVGEQNEKGEIYASITKPKKQCTHLRVSAHPFHLDVWPVLFAAKFEFVPSIPDTKNVW